MTLPWMHLLRDLVNACLQWTENLVEVRSLFLRSVGPCSQTRPSDVEEI